MSINRLLELRQDNNQAAIQMMGQSSRFEAIRNRLENGTAPKAITGFNLFQTPIEIAEKMAGIVRADLKHDSLILEPSAGLGRLVKPLNDLYLDWVLIEEQIECCRSIEKMYSKEALSMDFLQYQSKPIFDAVIMNPPFKQGTDIKHIEHALSMVKPGGRLVSLCYDGVKQNKQLKPIVDHWEQLPSKSFQSEGTGANVSLIIINK